VTELGEVIYSTALADEPVQVSVVGECPRELLGLSCLVNEYECLCQHVVRASLEVAQHERGTPLAGLTVELKPLERDWSVVRKSLELVGYRADYRVSAPATLSSGLVLVATFDLYRPQNAALRMYLAEGN
jgi:hypothetical protein